MMKLAAGSRRMLLLFGIAGCAVAADAHAGTKVIPAPANARVEIHLRTGDVKVKAWDKDEIRADSSDADPPALHVKGSDVSIGSSGAFSDGDLKVWVPAKAEVSVRTLSGDVRVEGVAGAVRAKCVSGGVRVLGAAGKVSAKSVSGDVRVEGAPRDVEARSVSGDVEVTNATGRVSAGSVSGALRLRGITATRAKAKTTSGSIAFEGTVAADGRLAAKSFSGSVAIQLHQTDFELNARSRSGAVALAGFTLQDADVKSEAARGRAGKGGARISVRTFSGGIAISAQKK